jgi:hypothetical protein
LAQSFLDTHKDAVNKAQVALDKASEAYETFKNQWAGKPGSQGVIEIKGEAVKEAQKALEDARDRQVTATAAVKSFQEQTEALADAEKKAQSEVQKHITAVQESNDAIAKEKAVADAMRSGRNANELTTAGIRPGFRPGQNIERMIDIAEQQMAGSAQRPDQNAVISKFLIQLRNAGASNEMIVQVLNDLTDLHMTHDAKIRDIWSVIKNIQARVKGVANP